MTPQTGLRAISRALSQRGIAKKIQVIAKARVPIIKFVEMRSGLSFDISFDVENGPKAADFIKDAVVRWPSLRPLCLILKVFLQQRELNEVYTGGIGSYALLTMLMAALKNQSLDRSSPEHNLGILLINFFDLYGRKLNINDVGVSCSGFFSKHIKGFMNHGRPFLISIEDPQTPENDIGKNSFNYFQVRSAFAMAYSTLTNPKTILAMGPNRSILGTIIRPDPVLLHRKGGKNGDVTFSSLLPGAGEPLMSRYDHQDTMCNWQLDDEEALPRGNGFASENGSNLSSPGKKRKSSSSAKKSNKKRLKEEKGEFKKNDKEGSPSQEKGSRKKKARWRHRKGGQINGTL
ncbi:Terminal nucleotidyltransferase 4B [Linum perenne]